MTRMATRALERGSLERQPVARAEVLATDATGVLLRTTAWPHSWLTGPFPPPPDRSRRPDTMPCTFARARASPWARWCNGWGSGPAIP